MKKLEINYNIFWKFNYKLTNNRKPNMQESQYASSLIEASLDPLVTISTEGKITDMNQALTHITGISREELTGTYF